VILVGLGTTGGNNLAVESLTQEQVTGSNGATMRQNGRQALPQSLDNVLQMVGLDTTDTTFVLPKAT